MAHDPRGTVLPHSRTAACTRCCSPQVHRSAVRHHEPSWRDRPVADPSYHLLQPVHRRQLSCRPRPCLQVSQHEPPERAAKARGDRTYSYASAYSLLGSPLGVCMDMHTHMHMRITYGLWGLLWARTSPCV